MENKVVNLDETLLCVIHFSQANLQSDADEQDDKDKSRDPHVQVGPPVLKNHSCRCDLDRDSDNPLESVASTQAESQGWVNKSRTKGRECTGQGQVSRHFTKTYFARQNKKEHQLAQALFCITLLSMCPWQGIA